MMCIYLCIYIRHVCPRHVFVSCSALDLLLKTEALPAEALPASMLPLLAEGLKVDDTGDLRGFDQSKWRSNMIQPLKTEISGVGDFSKKCCALSVLDKALLLEANRARLHFQTFPDFNAESGPLCGNFLTLPILTLPPKAAASASNT